MVAMNNTDMVVAHIPVKMDSPDTSSGVAGTSVAGDIQKYRMVHASILVEACTSLVVVAWQLAVNRQQVENTPQSVSMRLVETDDRGKDTTECYTKWPPTEPGLNGNYYKSLPAEDTGQSRS
jgi:hypothetical protein